ncbi:hypothetical protein MAR_035571 [Mya arenaria]|uniref:Uncharacterized protein n=2 Tax=Mya arenaria TaxID=6604 RepID=A0ABY7EMQ1_MYAAR|nr:hypothetical protein MAR_035571 [Mya arenaria]
MELEKEMSEKRKELKEVENERKEARTQMVRAAMSIGETDGKKFLSETMRPTALTGNVGAVVGVIESGLNLANDIFQFVKKGSQFAAMDKAQAKIEKDNEQQFKQLQEMKREMQEKREQKLQQIHKIKTLTLQIEAGVGDMENLREAVLHLGKVQRLLGEISAFWETMLGVVKFLQKNDEGNDLHILTMKYKPTDATKDIEESKQYWTMFGSICHGYARESTKEIGPLYSFLERPLDELSPGERMEKTKQLIQSIEEDIDKTYPANDSSQ